MKRASRTRFVTLMALVGCGAPAQAPVAQHPDAHAQAPEQAPSMPPPTQEAETQVKEPRYEELLADPGRDETDRALDAQRKPFQLLTFIGVQEGMRVAELGAGGGYTTELIARVVGPTGEVYGHNSLFLLERFAQKPWTQRLLKPVNGKVIRQDRPFDDPLAPEVKDLDAVIIVLFYHDTVWQGVDRPRMNRAVFDALKPGGLYVIVDHSARVGSGVNDVKTLHRIEEAVVRDEVTQAGFVVAEEADFLREPGDARDWNAAPSAAGERRGTSDRFVIKFQKPLSQTTRQNTD